MIFEVMLLIFCFLQIYTLKKLLYLLKISVGQNQYMLEFITKKYKNYDDVSISNANVSYSSNNFEIQNDEESDDFTLDF